MLTVTPLGFLLGASFATCVAADAGDDFSNNLISDLAPLLALFGERVTTQFMSQSVGWADNIILAVAPLGILTAIVSAVRVGGPSWLKTIIGRARENRAVAESELMSSTSHEVCELWNGQQVVRVMGAGPIREFIVLTCEGSTAQEVQPKVRTIAGPGTPSHAGAKHGPSQENDGMQPGQEVAIRELRDAMGVYLTRFEPSFWECLFGSRRPKGGSLSKTAASREGEDATRQQLADSSHDSRSERSAEKQQSSQPQDPEKALPVINKQAAPAQPGTAEGHPKPRKRLVAVIRNTGVSTPNLTLNIHSQASRRELYAVALIGITLQLGVLVYFGIAAQFPAVMYTLLKDDHVVARYALPCAVVGTVLLVASMLICAHVVEASTSEMRYRPVEGVEARVVWLQRSETVNDQAFDSFAIFPAHAQAVITTSRRASRRRLAVSWWPKQNEAGVTVIEVENVVAVVGALIGICGFIVQFVGLRSMHWSASAAQLGATIIMTVLRASVRRNLSKNPQSRPLLPGHEMDWLAMALGGPESVNDSWLSKSGRHWDWRVVAVEDPSRCEKLRPQSGIASREICESMSQRAALTRRDLGALADWYGPASPDAIALARAIEATLNAFDDLITRDAKELIWSLPALKPSDTPHREPIAFRVKRQQDGNWVTFADEIEAALSLWLYSVHERENPQSSVEGRREKEEDGRAPVVMPLQKRGDEWLRSKGSPAKRSLRLLGSYSQALQQDVRLWMPDGSVRVIGVGQNSKKFTDESKTIEMDRHRMVGHAFGWTDSDSPKESRIRLTKITLPDQDSAVDGTPINTILATESYSPLTTLFVHHMFTTFMWAIAKTIEKPIADSADIRITEVDEANGDLRRRSFALHTSRLSKLAQDIQSTGLGRLEDVYLCILPPLSIENKLPPTCKHTKDVNGRTPLHLVAVAGSEADVRRVVELGADKDARDDKNQTPLHVAIAKGNLAVARAVIDLGANIEARTLDGWTPLAAAARYGHAEIVVALAQRGADKEARNSDGWTPLAIAARYGHAVAAETIIRLGANKEAETSDGWTPLVLAARYGNTRVVETLIKLGVCADATTSRGWLPLFQAASEGEEGTTRMLIKHGANTEVKNLAGRTPLHGAASKGATAVVKALVELKADKEARDNFNGTPLHWAAAGGHTETVRALVRLGTDKNSRVSGGWISHYEAIVAGDQNMKSIAGEEEGSGGQTPMHLAAMNGHAAVIEALIELGADRNAKDRRGWTPRDWAERGAMRRLRTS